MMGFKQLLLHVNARSFIDQARFGIEWEGQRVGLAGSLAKTDRPAIPGDQSYHPYIQIDFSGTQTEMITPITDSIPELFQYLAAACDVTTRSISKKEMIWPLSMPPALPEKDEEIIIAKLKSFKDVLYRRYLAKKYGKRKQMISGIHFNLEFDGELLRTLFSHQEEFQDLSEFKTGLYLKTARNFMRYHWVITYLFDASPVNGKNYFLDESHPQEPVRSIRNSVLGYANHPNMRVSHTFMKQCLADIERMIEEEKLSKEKEFYTPLRFRGGKKVIDLAATGVRYIKLRNIDLNPYTRLGINPGQVRSLQLFLMYMSWAEEKEDCDQWVVESATRSNKVALEQLSDQAEFHQEGREILEGIKQMPVELDWSDLLYLVEGVSIQMDHPEQTLTAKFYQEAQLSSQQEVAVALGHQYYKGGRERPYQLAGFHEMELSTRVFMFDAIQKGVQVKVLDESDQFLRLQLQDRVEYVKNTDMTSKDSYIVPLIMENKTVTEKVLEEAGFRVPGGTRFSFVEEAAKAYPGFAGQAFVIEPKSINYGLNITIFKEGTSLEDYQAGLAIVFREDGSVSIEEFMPGTEYRLLMIGGEVQATMLRVPASVVGDSIRTVKELVEEKSNDPLRGANHRAPLELIQSGELEQLMLREQRLAIESVPQANRIVYLRGNSSISTGGDSIDTTDKFSEACKKIAVSAVEALGAKTSGTDLIISDKEINPATDKKAYGIIEANFNPATHIHVYPFTGKGRGLAISVLKLLYPEVF